MGRTNYTFAKHQREMAKKQKKEAKRQRKAELLQQKSAGEAASTPPLPAAPSAP